MATTRLPDLAAIIDLLDASGRLARVKSGVDPRHELSGIAHRLEGGPRAVLFEAVKGHRWPVLAGLYWNRGLVAGLMGIDEAALAQRIGGAIANAAALDPVVIKSGPVLEVTEKDVDLGAMPVPVHALKDDWPSLDAVVIAKDPETSARIAAIQRFEMAGCDALRVTLAAGNLLEASLATARRLGRSLWVTLNCGVAPGLHLAASAPAAAMPIDGDVFGVAGALEGAPLALVPGTESDVEMAAHAMWALECEIVPGEPAIVRVRRIHRRAQPVFHTLLPGREAWISAGLLAETKVLGLLRQQVLGVTDFGFAPGGAGCDHAIVQIAPKRAGWSKHAILAAFAACPPLKMVTAVDDDVDIRKAEDVAWAMATRLDPATGIVRIENGGPQDHAGAKIGFDATQPFPKHPGHERAAFAAVALAAHEIATPDVKIAAEAGQAAPAPQPVPAAEYDTDRIWQREIAAWKKGGQSAEAATAKPAPGTDWDENRWLKRELEAMQRATAKTVAPPAPAPSVQTAAASALDANPADNAVLVRKSSDWNEDRWLTRELEAMQRERGAKLAPPPRPLAPIAAGPAPQGSSDWDETRWLTRELEAMKRSAPKRAAQAPKPASPKPAPRAAPPKAEPLRAADIRSIEDEDGGFFHSGTA